MITIKTMYSLHAESETDARALAVYAQAANIIKVKVFQVWKLTLPEAFNPELALKNVQSCKDQLLEAKAPRRYLSYAERNLP